MLQSRRHRRLVLDSSLPDRRWFSFRLAGALAAIIIALLLVWEFWNVFNPLHAGKRVATLLALQDRGDVYVTIHGEEGEQRAETGLRLYEGDVVRTGTASRARLNFFDGSIAMLDERSSLGIGDVVEAESPAETSYLSFTQESGVVSLVTGTGAVDRTVETALFTLTIPPRTHLLLTRGGGGGADLLQVRESTGPGVIAEVNNLSSEVVVGEGQQLRVTDELITNVRTAVMDIYDLRSVLALSEQQLAFIGTVQHSDEQEEESVAASPVAEGEQQLIVTAPTEGTLIETSTVLVQGTVGARVAKVSVNGYGTDIVNGAFGKEIALTEEGETSIEIRAEGQDGLLLDSRTIAVHRDIRPPDPPVITTPGTSGSTVAVQEDTFEIGGTASEDMTGIVVNDYQLQKYVPGKPWQYLVDPSIGNVKRGENTYTAYAIDRSGNKSTPAVITVVWKAEVLGSEQPVAGGGDEPPLHAQRYLQPGSLKITSPTSGEPFATALDALSIEGVTSPDTSSVSVNGFSLTLYTSGATAWRYVLNDEYKNYRVGKNTYTIVARNSDGKILDVLRYAVDRNR